MKKWLRGQPEHPSTIDDLQGLLDAFVAEYNEHRPHRSLEHRATPTTVYTTRPKATPSTRGREEDTHNRVRHDKVDKAGKVTWRYQGQMYSIGIGRTHTGTTSSSCPRTSTSGSSTPPPANYSASSPSTQDATTSPPANHQDQPPQRN